MPDAVAAEFIALQSALAGRYSLERELGRGGMGIVFLARDVALDRLVALKLLPPAMAAQPPLRERFLREAQMAAKLSHPNIIPIFSVEQVAEFVFFVMAFVEGETLGQRLRTRGPLRPAEGIRMLQEVAWALAYAHLRGIVHRDIKPDNILLEQGTGRALVSDFGIARATETSGGTAVGEVLGTAQYMSPEQACGEPVDGRSDLYALGVVAFYALSGKLPFDAPDIPALLAMHITRPAPPLASIAPGVPGRLARAVDKCLVKDPAQRFESGEALAEAVAQSTEVTREVPAPIRVWLTKGEGARVALYGWTAFLGLIAVSQLVAFLLGGTERFPLEILAWLGVPWGVFGLYRRYHTQNVLASGYTFEDLRLALRQHIERRREDLAFEYGREPPWWAKLIRKLTFGGVALSAGTLTWMLTVGITPEQLELFAGLFFGGTMLTFVGAGLGRLFPGKRMKARDSLLEYRARLMDTAFGRWLFKLTSLGVKRDALPAGATHRPTEIAIGLAAEALFEALPKDERRDLKDCPGVVRRLEADAQGMRARVDELNEMLAGVGDESPSGRSTALQHRGASEMSAALGDQRERMRRDLGRTRDVAAKRLATAVAALENIRLDLLRLKAGVGTVDQLSADLSAALNVQAEIEAAIEGRHEVEEMLRTRKPIPDSG